MAEDNVRMLASIADLQRALNRQKRLYRALWGDLPGAKKKPKKVDEEAKAWVAEYREWAVKVGWPVPNGGMQGAYRDCQNQVRKQGESWPSWETLTRGAAMAREKWNWKPSDPYWLLAKKKVEGGYFPNILKIVNLAGQEQPAFRDIPRPSGEDAVI
jgi:hypothetical protein